MTAARTVHVGLGDRAYDILVGDGLLADAGEHLLPLLGVPRVAVVTDDNVAPLHLPTLLAALDRARVAHHAHIVPAGEDSKSFAGLDALCSALLGAGVERGTTLIALGGGVVGDLAGFAAAVLLRGIDFVQMPTTLLAQVDSSVGGKTGINTPQGKNLVGAFHQPRLVLADMGVLDTLPVRELRAGYAEMVKYGLIRDPGFFAWLEEHGISVLEGGPARAEAVERSCRHKAEVVAADEREGGVRALLNLGHTFAHALEAETGYSTELLHGEAVAMGMVMAFDLAARLGQCPLDDAARVRRHLASVGLPTGLEHLPGRVWSDERLLAHMRHDKKVRDGRLVFILPRGIGDAVVARDVELDQVRLALREAIAA